jgi:uncharacterized protein (TIGR02145 family)
MYKVLSISVLLFFTLTSMAQVGIGTTNPNASAQLDVSSTTTGFLPPRMTTAHRNAIVSPATGLVIFNTTTNSLEYKSSTGWVSLTAATTTVNYPSVLIGAQYWMEKNLEVTTYRNGDPIPYVTDATAWAALTTGAWCYYNNDPANGSLYGKLYNWYAVNDPRGLAPVGWHVPTDGELTTLSTTLGGDAVAGGKMKVVGTTRWTGTNTGANNSSGFAGLPGSNRNSNGLFGTFGDNGNWWSSTEGSPTTVLFRSLNSSIGSLISNFNSKKFGYSVRCIKD